MYVPKMNKLDEANFNLRLLLEEREKFLKFISKLDYPPPHPIAVGPFEIVQHVIKHLQKSRDLAVEDMKGAMERNEQKSKAIEFLQKQLNNYDGNWMDEMGVCKVCGGEIPHGHTDNCDILKLEQEVNQAKSEAAGWLAQLKVFKQQGADQTKSLKEAYHLLDTHTEHYTEVSQWLERNSWYRDSN